MAKAKSTKKLLLDKQTIRSLTDAEAEEAVGGILGVMDSASNATSGDWNGVRLSAEWYLQKYTLRCKGH
jgi:hypothetical protein